jgi:hypothetical protein
MVINAHIKQDAKTAPQPPQIQGTKLMGGITVKPEQEPEQPKAMALGLSGFAFTGLRWVETVLGWRRSQGGMAQRDKPIACFGIGIATGSLIQ